MLLITVKWADETGEIKAPCGKLRKLPSLNTFKMVCGLARTVFGQTKDLYVIPKLIGNLISKLL